MDDCRSGLLSGMDALEDSLSALEGWYYGQILRGEPLYPPAYGKVLTSAVTIDEVRRVLEQYKASAPKSNPLESDYMEDLHLLHDGEEDWSLVGRH